MTITPTQSSILLFDFLARPPDIGREGGVETGAGPVGPLAGVVGGAGSAAGGVCVGAGVGSCGFIRFGFSLIYSLIVARLNVTAIAPIMYNNQQWITW